MTKSHTKLISVAAMVPTSQPEGRIYEVTEASSQVLETAVGAAILQSFSCAETGIVLQSASFSNNHSIRLCFSEIQGVSLLGALRGRPVRLLP